MSTIKTVFLAALLSAAAYGVYVGVTGAPPNFGPRRRVRDWEETTGDTAESADSSVPSAPLVSIGGSDAPIASGNSIPPLAGAPAFGAPAPHVELGGALGAPPIGAGPPANTEGTPEQYSSDHRYPSSPSTAGSGNTQAPHGIGDSMVPPAHPAAAEMTAGIPPGYHDQAAPREEGHAEFAGLMQSVRTLLAENRLAEAHLQLSEWYNDSHFSAEESAEVTDLLDRLAGTVIYSREHLLERPYEVQPGDTLEKIADAYEVPWQLLANINGLRDPRAVRPGESLKVVKGPFNAYVNLSKFELLLYLGSRYAGRFPIGIGKDKETPEGTFEVLQKVTNPTYHGAEAVVHKDDPNNPMGEFAIDLGNHIWIHGTNDPQSIGRADSRGCIRLGERDIKDLFEILSARSDRTAGSQVTIRR